MRSAAERARRRRHVALLRSSGLFDPDWYRRQHGLAADVDAAQHHLDVGGPAGRAAHPLYDPAYHAAHDASVARSDTDPFVHFLDRAAARDVPCHPLFDAATVVARHPQAARHPQGAWGWFLEDLDRPTGVPVAWLPGSDDATPRDHLALVAEVAARHAAVPDHTEAPRSFDRFDHAAGSAHVAAMAEVVAGLSDPPTVSVVIPTKDRAAVLPAAIDAVLAQTYPHWELLVVDDGSTDDTPAVLAGYDDPRLTVLRQPNAGVAAARNTGLRAATGDLVAYLDSDNTWVPEFLTTMVGTLHVHGARAAYAASELRGDDGHVEYRGRPFDAEVLRERNFIDCITLVHDRTLLDEVGGFDEALRRVVDWDLLIRLSEVTDLVYAPFVATAYDLWDEGGERITMTESIGYRYQVRAKHLIDWAAAPSPVPGRTSVVLPVARDDEAPAPRLAEAVDAHLVAAGAAEVELEVVIVDDGTPAFEAQRLRALEVVHHPVRVLRVADRISRGAAVGLGASSASGDVLVVVDPWAAPDAAALQRCAQEVRDGYATAVQPLWLDVDGTVLSSGWRTTAGGRPVVVGAGLGPQDALVHADRERDALDPVAYAVDAWAFRAVGGLSPVFVGGLGEVDLGRRLREQGGTCRLSRDAVDDLDGWAVIRRHLPSFSDERELQRRGGTGVTGTAEALIERVDGIAVDGWTPTPRASFKGPQRWSATYVRRPGGARRWAIKTAVDTPSARTAWGDWHFALALRDALAALGEQAVVDLRRGWFRASASLDDIDIVLRGTKRYEPPPDRRSLLWVISHPAQVTAAEAASFDAVGVASVDHAPVAAARWGRDVATLLQATDPSRFHPVEGGDRNVEVLFVGNSRGVRRRIVADAIEAGLEPAIYGAGWEGLVPDHLVRGTHVPNEQLGRLYASAEVVLADHWDDMRQLGFVANRVFDAVACGAAVVSDDVPGLASLFSGAVRTYRGADELASAVAAARRDRVRGDVTGHTFEDRARALVAWADGGALEG